MKIKSNPKIIFSFVFVILIISLLGLFIGTSTSTKMYIETRPFEDLQTSRVTSHSNILWVENPTFQEPVDPWFSSIDGDISDAITSTSPNQSNFIIIGNSGKYNFVEIPDETWQVSSNPEWGPLPDLVYYNNNYSTDNYGAFLTYTWDENGAGGQLGQNPSVQWKKTIPNIPVDMSDYIITSASLKVMFNATVQATDHTNGGIDTLGDTVGQFAGGDYVRFYVKLSDPNNITRFTQAYNQSRYLGQDARADGDGKDYFPNSILSPSESRLIGDLESLFELNDTSLTILLGINIFCEDNNAAYDHDYWEKLRIKDVNLTFTYEKKINERTSLSWNQELNAINGSNVQITAANLRFKFKIDQNWTESSQNSQIRVYINDRKYEQTISLIDYIYSTDFQEARIGGFDIVSKILPYESFNLTIQVYLADEFGLAEDITISITDVYLYISYTETFPDPPSILSEPWFFSALLAIVSVAIVCLGGYFIAYQRILKYPRPVRKVRKFKRTLNKTSAPDIPILPREIAFKKSYNKQISGTSKSLRLKASGPKDAIVIEKSELAILTKEALGKKIDSDKLINQSLEKKGELDDLIDKLPEKSDHK